MPREFDIVIYGATGFTGRQVARYFERHAPAGLRWAVAGRDRGRLEALGVGAPVVVADADDHQQLTALAQRTRVLVNTAGPFKLRGDAVVAACVEVGTDYCDISGEPARIRDLLDRQHAAAQAAGVRVVPWCGVSSVPADLGVHLLHQRLGDHLARVTGVVEMAGGFNGGSIASRADAVASGDAERERDPLLLGPGGRQPTALERDPRGVRFDAEHAAWVVGSPLGLSDTRAVRRSAAITGRDVEFQEYLGFGGRSGLAKAVGMGSVLGLLGTAYRFGVTRRLLTRAVPPGRGPSERVMEGGFYRLRLRGSSTDGRTAEVGMSGRGDPGNRVTVLCASEAAFALALDGASLPQRHGVLTPSTGIGDPLVARLSAAGMAITGGMTDQ